MILLNRRHETTQDTRPYKGRVSAPPTPFLFMLDCYFSWLARPSTDSPASPTLLPRPTLTRAQLPAPIFPRYMSGPLVDTHYSILTTTLLSSDLAYSATPLAHVLNLHRISTSYMSSAPQRLDTVSPPLLVCALMLLDPRRWAAALIAVFGVLIVSLDILLKYISTEPLIMVEHRRTLFPQIPPRAHVP